MPGDPAEPNVSSTKGMSMKDKDMGTIIACPECSSEILDVSKAPEEYRCIVCKNVFEIETEESRLRKGKETPHRIRKMSRFAAIFKKSEETIKADLEEDEIRAEIEEKEAPKLTRTKADKTKLIVIGISVGLMIFFLILAILNALPVVDKLDENGEVVTNDQGEVEKEPLLGDIVLSETIKEIELEKEEVVEEKFEVKLDWLIFLMIGMMCLFGPIGIYESGRNSKIVRLEERLADFLRDLAESSRSGQTLHEAIITSSGGEYGELLPEIKKMSIQISWGVSATEALNRFADRVRTPLVRRAVTLINEASAAGGDVSKVLEAAANDTKEIQMLMRERKIQMSLYVAVIFISFVVFLVVILIVYATFVPEMKKLALQQSGEDEEESESGAGAQTGMAFSPAGVDFGEIKMIFIAAALVHAVGDGLVAGLMGSGKMTDGLKISFAMILIVFMIFGFLMPAAAVG